MSVDAGNSPAAAARILVVDDDPMQRELTAQRLAEHGWKLQLAASWNEAAAQDLARVELAVLDVRMTTMQGDSLCRILKRLYPRMKVLLHSSIDEHRLAHLAKQAGADAWLSKSAPGGALISEVRRLLGD